jgi:tetratricopeptide (TPR) repeat protein
MLLMLACGGGEREVVSPRPPETAEPMLPVMDARELRVHYSLGIALLDENQYSRAWPHVRAVLESGDESWPMHLAAAQICLFWQMDYDCVREHAGHVLETSPEHPQAHALLGRAYQDEGEIDEAISHYRTVLAVRGTESGIVVLLANLLDRRGDHPGALEVLRDGLAHSPLDGRLMIHLAVILEETAPGEAEALYREAADRHEDPASALGHLIRFYERQGRDRDAESVRLQVEELAGAREMRPIR